MIARAAPGLVPLPLPGSRNESAFDDADDEPDVAEAEDSAHAVLDNGRREFGAVVDNDLLEVVAGARRKGRKMVLQVAQSAKKYA